MRRTYKYRVYPNEAQKAWLAQSFGNCRWLWNHMLDVRQQAYKERGETLSGYDCDRLLTALKKDNPWLKETPISSLQQVDADLDHAFKAFFSNRRKGRVVSRRRDPKTGRPRNPYGHPRYHGKKGARESICIKQGSGSSSPTIYVDDDGRLRLPKMPGTLKVHWSRMPEGAVKRVTLSRDRCGDYFVAILCDGVEPEPQDHPKGNVGLDMGVKHMLVASGGEVVDALQALGRNWARLARLQRKLSRAQEGSNRYRKLRRRVARLHRRIANMRKDFQDKLATSIAKGYAVVSVEDLETKWWWQDGPMAKKAQEAALGQFMALLEQRCERYGSRFVRVGRTFPSTQLCSACGVKAGPKGKEGLKVRRWVCPECGTAHDRDLNAAANIDREGLRILQAALRQAA
jgi:putative transposase